MTRIPKDETGKRISPPLIEPHNFRMINDEKVPLVTQTRSYGLITPMFGGGTLAKRADSGVVIRGSSIRGQLRFWWRACRGGKFKGDLGDMREAENLLWGAASTKSKARPSQVQIIPKTIHPGTAMNPYSLRPSRRSRGLPSAIANEKVAPPYAAFPLQPEREDIRRHGTDTPLYPVLAGVKFDLTVVYPEKEREEVDAALWAWETFGGIGGRTRRGFGALKLTAIDGKPVYPPKHFEMAPAIASGLDMHCTPGPWPKHVPHISRNLKMTMTGSFGSCKSAWDHLIKRLSDFRQMRYRGQRTPGRSKWPEPDEIRALTGKGSFAHKKRLSRVEKFPRAAFGLPIQFHFKDEKEGDPSQTTLRGSADENLRLAGPLILRPLSCQGDVALGLAAILEGTGVAQIPGGVILKGEKEPYKVSTELTRSEAAQIEALNGNPDVLGAFLESLTKGV